MVMLEMLEFNNPPNPNDRLDIAGIPINARKFCMLECGTTGLRCNYFAYYYDRDMVKQIPVPHPGTMLVYLYEHTEEYLVLMDEQEEI